MASAYHLSRKLQKLALTELRETRLPQIGRVGGNVGVGKVFYVNGNRGSDSSSGETPGDPFKTITYALTKCTDRNDDTILVTRDTTEAAYPVSIEKRDIHIFAWDEPRRIQSDKMYFSSGAAACFTIAAQNVEIAGFDFCCSSSYPCIQVTTTGLWNAAIHDCNFGMRGAAKYGILIGAGVDAPYMSVYDNYFGTGITYNGVCFDDTGNATRGWIGTPGHGNVFDVTLAGISANVAVLGGICDNIFLLPSDTEGYAITLEAGSSACMVNGNSAFYSTDPMSTNPYRDVGSNHWGLNYRQGESIMPVTA